MFSWYKKAGEPEEFDMVAHLLSRGVDPEKVKVYIDNETHVASFPFFTIDGKFIGFQQYTPNGNKNRRNEELGKYYTSVAEAHGGNKVWGMESWANRKTETLFVTEGIFDAVKIHNAGYPAFALIANNPPDDLVHWTKILSPRVIAIMDRGDAGAYLADGFDEAYVVPDPYGDLGEMPQKEVDQFISKVITGNG